MSATPAPSIAASIGHGREAPPMPRVEAPAHRIRDDAEAIAVARRLAEQFVEESAVRDREDRLPYQEIDEFSQSGLWGISVPQTYGGAGVSCATLAEVTAIISAADSSLGQIPQNHYAMVEAIRLSQREDQQRFFSSAC